MESQRGSKLRMILVGHIVIFLEQKHLLNHSLTHSFMHLWIC